MLISMTGFGTGEATSGGSTVSVEIRSVNHRFLDLAFKLPRVLQNREQDIKDLVRARLARGRVSITMSVESAAAGRAVTINEAALEQYLKQLRDFAKRHGLDERVSLDALMQLPEVVMVKETDPAEDVLWPLVEEGLNAALESCTRMRLEEGRALEKDLTERMALIGRTVDTIESMAPAVAKKQIETLRKRVAQLAGDIKVSEDRIAAEIVMLGDRTDITEEITRLKSHLAQFNKTISDGGEVSKKMTYLLQEMHREATTIGSKAADSEVIQHVVVLKEETEKLREQVQNLE
ncbi:MAG: YicC family protein [Candidatus Krumholzibacteria bacterium]|nr:YicC family protein [Candidatus Krumholzibacteria bacterium]MDH5270539.1 YicC family protein [Candidatus Krumholzibacteria bacterium]